MEILLILLGISLMCSGITNAVFFFRRKKRIKKAAHQLPDIFFTDSPPRVKFLNKHLQKYTKADTKFLHIKDVEDAFRMAYLRPLPLWRIWFCSFKDNSKWYDDKVKHFLKQTESWKQ